LTEEKRGKIKKFPREGREKEQLLSSSLPIAAATRKKRGPPKGVSLILLPKREKKDACQGGEVNLVEHTRSTRKKKG